MWNEWCTKYNSYQMAGDTSGMMSILTTLVQTGYANSLQNAFSLLKGQCRERGWDRATGWTYPGDTSGDRGYTDCYDCRNLVMSRVPAGTPCPKSWIAAPVDPFTGLSKSPCVSRRPKGRMGSSSARMSNTGSGGIMCPPSKGGTIGCSPGVNPMDNITNPPIGIDHLVTTPPATGCPVSYEDWCQGIFGNFCNWKVTFKNNFLNRPGVVGHSCRFLDLRRDVLQNKLNDLVIAGRNPAWQQQLQIKIGYINHLAFTYGCTTSAPQVGNQARVSQNPPPMRRRKLRGNQMQNISRNTYKL